MSDDIIKKGKVNFDVGERMLAEFDNGMSKIDKGASKDELLKACATFAAMKQNLDELERLNSPVQE